MTNIEYTRIPWNDVILTRCFHSMEVAKDQLETIINGWLVLDDGQFDTYPDAYTLYARIMNIAAIRYFSVSKKIDDDRLIFCGMLSNGNYRYYVR